jgi:hypothetical protein
MNRVGQLAVPPATTIDKLSFLDPGPPGLYIARHDDHDHDPPRCPPPPASGAGGRSLIVTRAAEGRAARLQIPAPILAVSDCEGLSHG